MLGLSREEKEIKRIEKMQKAKQQLQQLQIALNDVDASINKFRDQAKEHLLNNDQASFELVGSSIFYFQDVRKIINTVKIHYETFMLTSQTMSSIEGIRPCLKDCAAAMNSLPSMAKNSKDFLKFKRSLTRGQLNMKAMSDMLGTINPAAATTRTKEEFQALKESLLVGTEKNITPIVNSETNTDTATNVDVNANKDFFDAINID